jgi:hypothetical protein
MGAIRMVFLMFQEKNEMRKDMEMNLNYNKKYKN